MKQIIFIVVISLFALSKIETHKPSTGGNKHGMYTYYVLEDLGSCRNGKNLFELHSIPCDEPSKENEEPSRENDEPSKENEEPLKENEEPSRENEEPLKENEEPSRENDEPSKENEEPSRENEEPSKENDEPITMSTEEDETSDPRPLSKRILNGLEVPFSDNITLSSFGAKFKISDNATGYCNVNFVEKSHLLATSANCCYTQNFPVGPRLELTNGVTRFMVDVFVTLVPGTYVPGERNDFCIIVLNKAVQDVDPLSFSFTSSNVNDTIHVYSFGPAEPKGPRSTRLRTGLVTVESTDNLGVIRVRAKNSNVCGGDSGGASKNNGKFNGIVMGNTTECNMNTIGAICEFKPLEKYIKDALVRFEKPPGE